MKCFSPRLAALAAAGPRETAGPDRDALRVAGIELGNHVANGIARFDFLLPAHEQHRRRGQDIGKQGPIRAQAAANSTGQAPPPVTTPQSESPIDV